MRLRDLVKGDKVKILEISTGRVGIGVVTFNNRQYITAGDFDFNAANGEGFTNNKPNGYQVIKVVEHRGKAPPDPDLCNWKIKPIND